MRRTTIATIFALSLAGAACQDGTGPARPLNDPPSAQETLPPDAGDLEEPNEVVEPGMDQGTESDEPNEPSDAGSD